MALPSSGQISMRDMNTDRGISATAQIDLAAAGTAYNVSYTTNGSNNLGMNEFYGKSIYSSFSFGDWNGSVSVSQGGTVSYVTGNAAAVSVSPTSYGIVNTDTSRTISVTVTVPSGYSNSGTTVSGTKTATQQSTPTFIFANAGVSGFAVTQGGSITAPSVSAGTISSVTYVGSNVNSSYSRVNSDTTRTATVYVTVPGGYYNSGETVSGNTTSTQIASATFSYANAGVSGFAVAQDGSVTAPYASTGTVTNRSYSSGYSDGSYSIVNSITQRYVDVTVSVPAGYYNSGGTVSGTEYADQAATPTFTFGDWSGGTVNVDVDGYVTATKGNASAVSVSPTYYGITYSTTARAVTVTLTVPYGYYNSGGTVSDTVIVYQPATPPPCYRYYNYTGVDQFNVNYVDCSGFEVTGGTVYADDYVCAQTMYSSFMTYGGNC